jgi:hypothetical protein
MNTYPRETVEFQPVAVTVNGTPVTTGVQFAIAAAGARPITWAAPVTLNAQIGVMVENLQPGVWHVWAQITSTPEIPVIDCGAFEVS